jgi:hypothetical protein
MTQPLDVLSGAVVRQQTLGPLADGPTNRLANGMRDETTRRAVACSLQ